MNKNDDDIVFIAYNLAGEDAKGAIQIIDFSNDNNPKIFTEIKFNNADINTLYYNKKLNEIVFGGNILNDDNVSVPFISKFDYFNKTSLNKNTIKDQIENNLRLVKNDISDAKDINSGSWNMKDADDLLLAPNTVTGISYEQFYYVTLARYGGLAAYNNQLNKVNYIISYDDIKDLAKYDNYIYGISGDNGTLFRLNNGETRIEKIQDIGRFGNKNGNYTEAKATVQFFGNYWPDNFNFLYSMSENGFGYYSYMSNKKMTFDELNGNKITSNGVSYSLINDKKIAFNTFFYEDIDKKISSGFSIHEIILDNNSLNLIGTEILNEEDPVYKDVENLYDASPNFIETKSFQNNKNKILMLLAAGNSGILYYTLMLK